MANELNTIKVNTIQWSGRAEAALKNGGLLDKTLADLEKMEDGELLSVHRLGRGSLGEIRQKTVQSAARLREDKLKQKYEGTKKSASETSEKSAPVIQETTTVASQPRPEKVRQETATDPTMEFAKSHPSIIAAIMSGEMILVPKL